jgi:hypothetical protein
MNVCAALNDKIEDVGNTVVDLPSSDGNQVKCWADLVDLHYCTVSLSKH